MREIEQMHPIILKPFVWFSKERHIPSSINQNTKTKVLKKILPLFLLKSRRKQKQGLRRGEADTYTFTEGNVFMRQLAKRACSQATQSTIYP